MKSDRKETMSCKCPRGHKLRGGIDLIGKTVRCPRCSEKFVFGYYVRENVSDTAVVRILGDGPAAMPEPQKDPTTRICSRCGVATSAKLSVCQHCNCYVGMMPHFLTHLSDHNQANSN